MKPLDERPVWSMSGSEKLTALDGVQAEITRLQVRRLHLTAGLHSDGYAQEIGARDTVHLLSIRYRIDPAEVRRDLRLVSALHKYPAVNAALGAGQSAVGDSAGSATQTPLSPRQAEAIVSTLEKVPASAKVPVEDLRVAEESMVEAAEVLPPGDLRMLGAELRKRLDTDGPEPDEDISSREALWLKKTERGVTFGGHLVDENAELFETLIFAGAKPHKTADGQRDPRPRSKRQADAFTAVLATAAGTGSAAPGHGDIKPHITVTIDLEDLKGGTGSGALTHGDSLSAAAVRRIACDAGVIPLVLGSNSEPLDVGTEHRFVTRAIRQALNARDRGCIVCGAPPAICEAHHIVHWADGGPTSLENLVLFCKRDHINIHHGRMSVHLTNGHPVVTRPAWSDPDPPPLPEAA